ncbi:MAG: TorD/DmsD family molecular chaperone [Hyphomicrobiaceae bacterium]
MPVQGSEMRVPVGVSDEDLLRAQLYRLISNYMAAAPDAETLAAGAQLSGDETPLGKAVGTFAHLCSRSDADAVAQEYNDLFIGIGRGELLPFASYYLTGFLNEKPLAKLRNDMDALGIERDPAASEPEDHIASIFEMMAGVIDGRFGEPASLEAQQKFYDTHIKSWASYFFRDLENAKSSVLYSGLGSIGRVFLEIEDTAFSMVPAG